MQIGIFARTFARPTLRELLEAIAQHGVESVQFNFSGVGLPTLPEQINSTLADQIRREFADHKLNLAAVSGTFIEGKSILIACWASLNAIACSCLLVGD